MLLNTKKEWNISIYSNTWVDLENIMFSKVSQKEKDKYYMMSFICGI